MNYSIAGIMNMNMFGVPHVGADVCGFFGEDLDQECTLDGSNSQPSLEATTTEP